MVQTKEAISQEQLRCYVEEAARKNPQEGDFPLGRHCRIVGNSLAMHHLNPPKPQSPLDRLVKRFGGEYYVKVALPPNQPSPTTVPNTLALVDEYVTYKADGGAADGYLKVRARKLRFFARQHPSPLVSSEVIRVYLRQFKTDDVPTRHDQWKALKALYDFASEKYHIPNSVLEVPKPHFKRKPGKRLSCDEARTFLTGVKTDLEWAVVTCYFGLRFRGMEATEQLAEDIKSDYLFVTSGKERNEELPLLPIFRKLLLFRNGCKRNETLFGLSSSTLAYHIEQVGKRVGLKVGPRMLRNTAAALWYHYGGDKASNRLLLRHSTGDMTDHYSNEFLDELKIKDNRHNAMLNLMRELNLAPKLNYPNTSSAQLLSPGVASGRHRY